MWQNPVNMRLALPFFVSFICIQISLLAQPFTKKYILSFHHCAIPNCGGPQNHTVFLAESNDAENWTLVPGFTGYQGSVPDVIIRGHKLYIYTPGNVKRYDHLINQWDAGTTPVSITDSIGNPVQFVDPSAYTDDSGRLCLFFLNSTGIAGDPAQCATPPCTAYFDSAIEVAGSDGTQFIKQNGHRIVYTTNTNFKPTDPDIFRAGSLFYQYISYGTGTMVYSANSLHGTYVQVASLPNGYLTNNNAGVPCGMFNPVNNLFYSYGHRNAAGGSEITVAKHSDYISQPSYNLLFTGSSIGLGNVQVASPGICENTFLASYLTEKNTENAFKIFPNPNNGFFEMHTEKDFSKICIYDLTGKIISTHVKTGRQQMIPFRGFKKGMYIVEGRETDNVTHYSKIIVQ